MIMKQNVNNDVREHRPIGTVDESRVKSGWTAWDVVVQRPHYKSVLTVHGVMAPKIRCWCCTFS